MELRIRRIRENNLSKDLFGCFNRHQEVTRVFRAKGKKWVIKDVVFTEEWGENEKEELVRCLANTLQTKGIIYGAFDGKRLVGFFSIESKQFGSQKQYVELSSLHVDYDYRGRGIGRKLFQCALSCVGSLGANVQKLYISSHSAVETQAFYRSMGCVEAEELNLDSLAKEPCDCQLECPLPQRSGSNMAGKSKAKMETTGQTAGADESEAGVAPQPVVEGGTTRQPDNWDSNVGGIL